ncbi:expressed unknown protein [Seminavis robusta]|uniref:Uncharacterized protein n=1 Tax=Seminavis robusta TaxID=568900 RepID=A0A9N8H0E7_9STRA|nr:expressed unknown protein [Seminavis robusta]|eukprot:Sro19_g013720.1 n/a (127) ;mRNA; f:166345-166725
MIPASHQVQESVSVSVIQSNNGGRIIVEKPILLSELWPVDDEDDRSSTSNASTTNESSRSDDSQNKSSKKASRRWKIFNRRKRGMKRAAKNVEDRSSDDLISHHPAAVPMAHMIPEQMPMTREVSA